jgi:4-amino-4-deoxy-L-arabinose transferase-like glycosyltransferase
MFTPETETRIAGGRPRELWLVLGVVLLLRLPFLNQAIQGDDHIYLTEAAHAQIEPLHPAHVKYVFLGDEVDLRGHSHPPLNAWALAGLIAAFGEVKEIPFHAAYIVFSMVAAWAMWSLARRFSPHPLWAALLFVATPAFVVNGNSLEADLPFLALWMAAIALFVWGGLPAVAQALLPAGSRLVSTRVRDGETSVGMSADAAGTSARATSPRNTRERVALVAAAVCMALAALAAYQAVFLTPILAVYVWLFHRRDRARWALVVVPPLVLAAWQLFERLTTGAAPASVLSGYFTVYGLQQIENKLASAAMLFLHSWFLVFPALVPGAFLLAWRRRREKDTLFPLAWIAIFFAGAVLVFFAGSARYLLPMAAPVALLASGLRVRWLAGGVAANMALGLALAQVNYQHWDACRRFAASLEVSQRVAAGYRVWVIAELGLRHYLEDQGALPLRKTQQLRPGDLVVSSELEASLHPAGPLAVVAKTEIDPAIPLRLIGVESHSGYSTVSRGFWPFGFTGGAIDRLRADAVRERRPTLEYLPMNAPEAADQIVSGVFDLEGKSRWISGSAAIALKNPTEPMPLRAEFYIPPNAPARRVTLLLDGKEVATRSYPSPGSWSLESKPVRGESEFAMAEIAVDKTFRAPGDERDLGVVVIGVGFGGK